MTETPRVPRAWLLALVLALLVTACADDAGDSELEQAEARWAASGITDYTLTIHYGCFCPREVTGPFEVEVSEGAVVSVLFDGEPMEPTGSTPQEVFTVEGLFAAVRDNADADHITVVYDDRGVPVLIDVDPIENAVDDELQITADLVVTGP